MRRLPPILAAVLLAACGQTGPLYLPDQGIETPVETRGPAAVEPQTPVEIRGPATPAPEAAPEAAVPPAPAGEPAPKPAEPDDEEEPPSI